MALPIDPLHWGLALLPILLLVGLLTVFRWQGRRAGPAGMIAAMAIALLAYQTSWSALLVAVGKGAWDALFILYVIWPAMLLYQVIKRAGAFEALRAGIERFSQNELFLILAFGWIFSSFLQGLAGFGTPIAIVAPLLIALGVKPLYAVAIPLVGSAWGHLFGSLATSWLTMVRVADLSDPMPTALQAALLLSIPIIGAGLGIAWILGGWPILARGWPLIAILSVILAGGQVLVTLWDPVLAAFIPSFVAMLALYPLSRWRRYAVAFEGLPASPIMRQRVPGKAPTPPTMGLGMALLPYLILSLVALAVSGFPPVHAFFQQVRLGFPFPAVATGYGVTAPAVARYAPLAVFTHPGTYLLVTSLLTYGFFRWRGYDARETAGGSLWHGLVREALPTSVAVLSFLITSRVMSLSGQTEVLALGIASVSSPMIYAFASNWLGILGGFTTSSTTASNALFGGLQQRLAEIEGLPASSILAAHCAGSAVGNAIAPADVVLGTATAGNSGEEGAVLRKTIPWTVIMGFLIGAGTLLLLGRIP